MLQIYPKFPIVIVEGCDCSGKSTLIKQLMDKHANNCYIHNAVTSDIYSLHENTINAALVASQEHWVFIDRLHLSEKIYGTIFRKGPSYDVDLFDKQIDSLNVNKNIHRILCLIDKESTLKMHSSRKEIEMFDTISKVWDMYNDVVNWKRYNWKTDNIDLDTLETTLKTEIESEQL